ncbi:hypothetical protein [Streptomyces sp. NBC_01716]|uniref:hypothetical protein n=1 Tax=Streptomyces sp. NBC_01716 TaxID=2975917 RepID=UPI002E36ED4F|nr:hypothetical protein [Streptomyces sp. NBC_01716]
MTDRRAALAFNAIAPALKAHDRWLPLSVRQAVAEAVLAAVDDGAPETEHCIHSKAIHHQHHREPVTGCPWCPAAGQAKDPA